MTLLRKLLSMIHHIVDECNPVVLFFTVIACYFATSFVSSMCASQLLCMKFACVATPATSVSVESVPCTALSLTYFDRLYNNEVVRESGNIVKCLDEYVDDMVLSDELRKVSGVVVPRLCCYYHVFMFQHFRE